MNNLSHDELKEKLKIHCDEFPQYNNFLISCKNGVMKKNWTKNGIKYAIKGENILYTDNYRVDGKITIYTISFFLGSNHDEFLLADKNHIV